MRSEIAAIIAPATPVSWMKRSSTSVQAITSTPTPIVFDTPIEDQSEADITFDGTKFVINQPGSYTFGGTITAYSTAQRAQTGAEVYINGAPTGVTLSTNYIRNSGTSWDFWPTPLAEVPFQLNETDTVELYVYQVTGGTYGPSGSVSVTLTGNKSEVWLKRMSGDSGAAGVDGADGGPDKTVFDNGNATDTVVIDYSNSSVQKITLTEDVTSFSLTNWPADPIEGVLRLYVDMAAAYTLDFTNVDSWGNGPAPTLVVGRNVLVLSSLDGGAVVGGFAAGLGMST